MSEPVNGILVDIYYQRKMNIVMGVEGERVKSNKATGALVLYLLLHADIGVSDVMLYQSVMALTVAIRCAAVRFLSSCRQL